MSVIYTIGFRRIFQVFLIIFI
jgi:hypothetical protein